MMVLLLNVKLAALVNVKLAALVPQAVRPRGSNSFVIAQLLQQPPCRLAMVVNPIDFINES